MFNALNGKDFKNNEGLLRMSDKIVKFLKDKNYFSISKLEKCLNIPPTTIHGAVYGKRKIPKKYIEKLKKELGL